jgi:hypothetical protein
VQERLAGLVLALRESAAVPAWVDPDAMAALILSVAVGVTVSTAVAPDGPDHRAIAAQFGALLLAARSDS